MKTHQRRWRSWWCKPQGKRRYRRLFFELLEERTLLNGGTLAEACLLPFMQNTATASGYIATTNEADLYKFDLAAGNTVTAAVRAQQQGSGLDSYLRVFNSAGVQITSNNDFVGRDSQLTFQAPIAGTYYA